MTAQAATKFVVLSLITIVGCAGGRNDLRADASPPTIEVTSSLTPAAVASLRTKTIAVLPFEFVVMGEKEGIDENGTAEAVAAVLVANGLHLVERAQLDRVMREAELSLTDYVDETKAPQLGELVGADVLVFGSFAVDAPLDARAASVTLRFVDVATGAVIATVEARGRSATWASYDEWRRQLVTAATVQ